MWTPEQFAKLMTDYLTMYEFAAVREIDKSPGEYTFSASLPRGLGEFTVSISLAEQGE